MTKPNTTTNDPQAEAIASLERQGFRFSNWIAAQPDAGGGAMDERQAAVLIKRKFGAASREYREVEPDGTVN